MVPKGWKKGLVSDLANTVMGYAFKSSDFVEDGIPLVRMGNLYQNQFQLDRSPIYLPGDFAAEYKRFLLKSGDLVMSMTGTMGKRDYGFAVEIPEKTQDCLLNQRVLKIEPINSDAKGFVLNLLKSEIFLSQLYSLPGGTKQANLSATQIREISVLIPPLPEQQKIAKILTTWDKAISTTERLIDNSQQQKKALMQQLLTGNQRLLDDSGVRFEGEWKNVYLHQVAKIIVSPVNKKSVEGETPVELCNYTDVYYNIRITQSLTFMKATAKQSEIDKYTLQVGDVIITKDSETPGDIAIPALVSEDLGGVVCGYHLAIIRPDEKVLEGSYLNYLLSMPKTRYYFFTLANGATRFGLSVGSINDAQFTLPPLEEQQKIATVLTNADREIELLEQQLADLQQEKRALMQQLLTGKKRVLVEKQ